MANSIYYVDGNGSSHTLYVAGTTADKLFLPGSEKGWGVPLRANYIERLPSKDSDRYRASIFGPRIYEVRFRLIGTSASGLETLKGQWETWHAPDLGEGYVKRVTHGGNTRCLDCVPRAPKWGKEDGFTVEVTQQYEAAFPWWRSESQSSASGYFNGATAVDISCSNGGDIEAWPVITIEIESGSGQTIDAPKVQSADGKYVQVLKSMSGDGDQIVIDMRPGVKTVKYYAGGAGSGTPCVISSGSQFWRLPTGTSNVTISASSGDAKCTIAWYLYYRSLY